MPDRIDEPVAPRRPRNRSQRQVEESAEIRAGIVRAAMEVFAEKGYALTTLLDIGGRVGLSRPALLHHFPSKDALFQEVLDELYRWGQNRFTGDAAGVPELAGLLGHTDDSRTPLRLIHVLEGEAIAGNPAAVAYTARRAAMIRGEVLKRLQCGSDDGRVSPAADLEAVSTLITAVINGLQTAWLLDPDADARAAFATLLTALTAQLGDA